MGLRNNSGLYRFLAVVDTSVFNRTYAKDKLNVKNVVWLDEDAEVALVLSSDPNWHLTATNDPAVDTAVQDQRVSAKGSKKDMVARNPSAARDLPSAFGAEDATTNWSAYGKNFQWPLQAMGCVDVDSGSDPDNRPPTWLLNNPDGNPYEGSKVKIGAFTTYIPAWYPILNFDAFGFASELDIANIELHQTMHWYNGISGASTVSDVQPIMDANPEDLHADGGVVGYDLDSEDDLVDSNPKFGPCTPANATGDKALPTGTVGPIDVVSASGGNIFIFTEGSKLGTGASFGAPDGTGLQIVTSAAADLTPDMVGKFLVVTGATNGTNNVVGAQVLAVPTTSTMEIHNPAGVAETSAFSWEVTGYSLTMTDDGSGNLVDAIPGSLSGAGATISYATGDITAGGVTWGLDVLSGRAQNWVAFTGFRTQQELLEASYLENLFGGGGAWGTQIMGALMSDEVGSSEVPNSALTTKDNRGRMKGLVPRATCICYCANIISPTGPGTFYASKVVRALLRAKDHKCQIFILPWSATFFEFDENFQDLFDAVLKAATKNDMLVVLSPSYFGMDLDESPSVPTSEFLISDRRNTLVVGGTGPRDYDPLATDLTVYNPDPTDTPQRTATNLDRPAVEGFNIFGFVYGIGFGASQYSKLDVAAPMGSFDPEVFTLAPIPFFAQKYNAVYTSTPISGGYSSLAGLTVDPGVDQHGWNAHDSMAVAHAAGAAALCFDAWYQKKGAWPKGKQIKKLLMRTADGRVGPDKDFAFISADKDSKYANDNRYTLALEGGVDVGSTVGDRFRGRIPPFALVFFPGGDFPTLNLWYSDEHPADKKKGKDPMYGKGRINIKDAIDKIVKGD